MECRSGGESRESRNRDRVWYCPLPSWELSNTATTSTRMDRYLYMDPPSSKSHSHFISRRTLSMSSTDCNSQEYELASINGVLSAA